MKLPIVVVLGILLVSLSCKKSVKKIVAKENYIASEISFSTADSIKIFGDLYELDKKNSTILLFHQGGSNARGEYASIIPRLIENGFNVLAIDQRMGGQAYGSYNRTLANIPDNSFGDGYGYCDAYNNIESALEFIIQSNFVGKKILWGSSYSASLAIQLASKRQKDIDGVLAFSPASGGPMKACKPDAYFKTLKVPLLLLRPPNEMENESSQEQFALAKEHNHRTYVPTDSVHGSSMLDRDRVKNDVDGTWKVVLSFIDGLESK